MNRCYIREIFIFLYFCMKQLTYSMENDDKGFFSHCYKKIHSYTLYFPFRNIVELAQKNNFSPQYCKIIKDYIAKGADSNWKIGERDETLLNLAVIYQKRDLLDFLLQHDGDINASNKNMRTPLHIVAFTGNESDDIQIKDLIQHKANIQARDDTAATSLHKAVAASNIYTIKSLINYGADINEKYNEVTPLALAICKNQMPELIIELCKLKASLTNITDNNNNIFHLLTGKKGLVHYIEPIITHARFDDFGKDSKKIVPFVLWILNNWKTDNINLPKDVKLHILSKLSLSDLYPYKKLCEALLKGNHIHILLPQIHERVKNIKQILVSPNNENETALQYAIEKFFYDQKYIHTITPLLNGAKLQDDYDYFITHFPTIVSSEKEEDKKNLVRQMFDNCAQLLLEQ